MKSFMIDNYAINGARNAMDFSSSSFAGKKQFPHTKSKSDVIVTDPTYSSSMPRKSLQMNGQMIQSQNYEIRRLNNLQNAGASKKFDPEDKNVYKYNKDSSTGRSSIQQGKSRSLFNDDTNI